MRDSYAMMLVLVGKRRRPFRIMERNGDSTTAPVRGVAYDKERGRWRIVVTTALELPIDTDSDACKGAHESLCWMFADMKDGDLPRGALVSRHELDSVYRYDADPIDQDANPPDGVVLNRSRRRGQVQVAWLLHGRR